MKFEKLFRIPHFPAQLRTFIKLGGIIRVDFYSDFDFRYIQVFENAHVCVFIAVAH
jgi:hypothetical protein